MLHQQLAKLRLIPLLAIFAGFALPLAVLSAIISSRHRNPWLEF